MISLLSFGVLFVLLVSIGFYADPGEKKRSQNPFTTLLSIIHACLISNEVGLYGDFTYDDKGTVVWNPVGKILPHHHSFHSRARSLSVLSIFHSHTSVFYFLSETRCTVE